MVVSEAAACLLRARQGKIEVSERKWVVRLVWCNVLRITEMEETQSPKRCKSRVLPSAKMVQCEMQLKRRHQHSCVTALSAAA